MDTVFLLEYHYHDDESEIVGVYSTRDRAQETIDQFRTYLDDVESGKREVPHPQIYVSSNRMFTLTGLEIREVPVDDPSVTVQRWLNEI